MNINSIKYILLSILIIILKVNLAAQNDPIAEIQGRLSIYDPIDTTSMAIGKNAGTANMHSGQWNTLIGTNAGANIDSEIGNTYLGFSSGQLAESNLPFNSHSNVGIGLYSARKNMGYKNIVVGSNAASHSEMSGHSNCIYGSYAGNRMTSGFFNCFFGNHAGILNTSGSRNVAIGNYAMLTNELNSFNVAIGDSTLYNIGANGEIFNQSFENTAVGASSLFNKNPTPVMQAVAVGYQAGYDGDDGGVYLGYRAGFNGGFKSVFLGYEAGKNMTGSLNNILVISNRSGDDALIYGEFDEEKVGINTSTPEMTLHIGGEGNDSRLLLSNGGDIFFKNSVGTNKAVLSLHSDDDTYLDAFDDLKLRAGNNTSQVNPDMIIQSDGDVGIGVINPTYKLEVGGSVRGTDIYCNSTSLCSDRRFKNKFKSIDDPLSIINQINGYYHHWRTEQFPTWEFPDEQNIGFKAQEIQAVLPEVVKEMEGGYLAVDYSKVVPLLVEGMKVQQEMIQKQQETISDLGSQLNENTHLLKQILSDK